MNKIFVVSHKIIRFPQNRLYQPIIVGPSAKDGAALGFLTDCTGTNIARLNPYFCELTAIYYILKNVNFRPHDNIGLCHYRRFFSKSKKQINDCTNYKEILTNTSLLLKRHSINSKTFRPHLFVPNSSPVEGSIREQYKQHHHIADFDLMLEKLKEHNLDLYRLAEVEQHNTEIYFYNMFIMSGRDFTRCWTFILELLLSLEKDINIESYVPYQRRVFGFLSERLFHFWIKWQQQLGARVRELPLINMDF